MMCTSHMLSLTIFEKILLYGNAIVYISLSKVYSLKRKHNIGIDINYKFKFILCFIQIKHHFQYSCKWEWFFMPLYILYIHINLQENTLLTPYLSYYHIILKYSPDSIFSRFPVYAARINPK